MPCIEITNDDFDDLHHALGRPDLDTLLVGECYRNYYATEAGSEWAVRAEQTGFWDLITRVGASMVTYRVNADGKSALADWLYLAKAPSGAQRSELSRSAPDEPLPNPPPPAPRGEA